MKSNLFVALLFSFLFSYSGIAEEAKAPAGEPAPEATKAAAELKGPALDLKKHLEVLFEHSKNVNSPDAKKKSAARSAIDSALDWEKIAEDAMGSANWKKQSAGNRADFKNLLKDVVVRTAYTRLDKFWDGGTTFSIPPFEVKNGKADVVSKFLVNSEEFSLNYYVAQKGTKWLIYDIAFEGERYSVNINEQISAFLKEKSFSNLMDKLRKRRDELASDTPKVKKG